MIQHFYDNDISSLCCKPKYIKERISELTDENIADIKNLPSIAKYLKTFNKVTNSDKLSNKEFKVRIVYESYKKAIKNYRYINNTHTEKNIFRIIHYN